MTDQDDYDDGDYWYKCVVLVPRKIGKEWIAKFFNEISDRAYEVQYGYDDDADEPGRDWDIFCYGTPEKDDK